MKNFLKFNIIFNDVQFSPYLHDILHDTCFSDIQSYFQSQKFDLFRNISKNEHKFKMGEFCLDFKVFFSKILIQMNKVFSLGYFLKNQFLVKNKCIDF